MSFRIMLKSKITGKSELIEFAEVQTREQAEKVLNMKWREYVDKHYNTLFEMYLEEVVYSERKEK